MVEKLKIRLQELLFEKKSVVIAIDGPCASGKTTLAENLSKEFDGNVIHMDHFFLRPEQKTQERLSQIGGNLDRERFLEEVLVPLSKGELNFYRPYLCSEGRLGEPIFLEQKKLVIVEGSYSHRPEFTPFYDLRVFLEIPRRVQVRRLLERDPKKITCFLEEWIPKEDAYFETFGIREKADLHFLNLKAGS